MESNSGYPWGYRDNGEAVGRTKALSTNVLYYSGYDIAAQMGKELGASENEVEEMLNKGTNLKNAIRSRLWLSDLEYYAYVEDENGELITQMEGLGESLALFDFEQDQERIQTMFTNIRTTERGLPCLWPQFYLGPRRGIPSYYHNGLLWPFVQGYWAMAAAKHKQIAVFADALFSLTELAVSGNTFAEFYELDGTFLDGRRRQLWSATGYLAMIYRGLFGMEFTIDGIKFAPTMPLFVGMVDEVRLEDMRYRDMVLDISMQGYGAHIEHFMLDGREVDEPFIPLDLVGRHSVMIKLRYM